MVTAPSEELEREWRNLVGVIREIEGGVEEAVREEEAFLGAAREEERKEGGDGGEEGEGEGDGKEGEGD